ncbi:glutamine amidotransferase [Pseudonocardia acidicola]|uniref:glutamine amidotransferase n=1 Tax=Pseudonocardia acidicola TaxID=2724939 RepID=UPI003B836EFD
MIVFALRAVQAYRASLRNVRGKNAGEGVAQSPSGGQPKVLFVGESWTKHTIHLKGSTSSTTPSTRKAPRTSSMHAPPAASMSPSLAHTRSHVASRARPALDEYAAVILSDIGSNSVQRGTRSRGRGGVRRRDSRDLLRRRRDQIQVG